MQTKRGLKVRFIMAKLIYLDYHSTTPCDPRVVEAMMPYFSVEFANPSNSYHLAGRKSLSSIEEAREKIADLIGAQPKEVVFTSGATESNNIAILGVANAYNGKRKKLVTTKIEHKSVLKSFERLTKQGFDLGYLPIDKHGNVIIDAAKEIIDENTLLVSVQSANNEIGTIQLVDRIADIAHEKGALIHCDAVQTVGKLQIDLNSLDVDLLSISAHKIYGPKGVGGLYINSNRKLPIEPLLWGGDQEGSLRPGTYNVPAIVGFGEACLICKSEMTDETRRIKELRDFFELNLYKIIPDLKINGNLQNRVPGNSSITFPGIDGDALLLNLPQLALSMGSACNTGAIEPSYVLMSIGLSHEIARSTIRVGIGRFTTNKDINNTIYFIQGAYLNLNDRVS